MDSAEIFRPDRVSTHFVDEKERFNKNFEKHDQVVRAKVTDSQQSKILNLRKERLTRDKARFDMMDNEEKF